MQMQCTVRWCVRDEETSEVKDCAERSVALRGSKEWTGNRKEKEEGEEEGAGEGGRRGTRILGDYRARHQRITASEDKIYM